MLFFAVSAANRNAFGMSTYFNEKDVEFTRGALKIYECRSDESNRGSKWNLSDLWDDTDMMAEKFPGGRGIRRGTCDDPNWFMPHVQRMDALGRHWMVYPSGVKNATGCPRWRP